MKITLFPNYPPLQEVGATWKDDLLRLKPPPAKSVIVARSANDVIPMNRAGYYLAAGSVARYEPHSLQEEMVRRSELAWFLDKNRMVPKPGFALASFLIAATGAEFTGFPSYVNHLSRGIE